MKKKNLLHTLCMISFACFLSACGEGQKTEAETWKGAWVGAVSTEPYPDLMHVYYDSLGWVRLFYNDVYMHEPKAFRLKGDRLAIEIEMGSFQARFEGKREGDVVRGTFSKDGRETPANLVKVVPADLARLGDLLGFFEFSPGHIVQIEPYMVDMSLTPLAFTDFRSGARRIAFPTEQGDFAAGPIMLNPYPRTISFNFPEEGDSETYDLVLNDPKLGSIKGKRLADLIRQEDMTIEHDGITLASTLTLPNTVKDDYPLAIFVPGVGKSTRASAMSEYIKLLPYYGVATLVYDKRGSGESTGDLQSSSFYDLASDIVAVVNAAAKMRNIQANNITLVGIDQASYTIPIAAEKLPDLASVVLISGSVMSLEEQEYQACAKRMKADKFRPAEIDSAIAYQKTMFAYLRGETDSLTLQAASDEMRDQRWSNYVTSFRNKTYIDWWRKYHDFNPNRYLQKMRTPILALFGEQDVLLEAEQHKAIFEALAQEKGDERSKAILYPKTNHFLILGESRGDFQFSEIIGYAPGLFNDINEWVLTHSDMLKAEPTP